LAEAVAAELSRAWERSSYHQRLMNLVQAGSQLSAMVEPAATTREIATIAREILQARFTFVQIQQGQERNFTESAYSGEAPRLLGSLQESLDSEALIKMAFNAVQPFRVRDVRKYSSTSHLMIDNPVFRSMLAIPIRWHRLSIGVILAFGKQNEVFFNENDESLAELLSIQAAGAFESAWLQQELRTSLRTTSLLYHLSNKIIQVDNLKDAARDIAQTAHKLAKSITTGVILFNAEGDMVAEVEISSEGIHGGTDHPMEIIRDVMVSGQLIYLSRGQSIIRACLPIQTPIRTYGAVWMDMPENQGNKHAANPNDLQALVSQTAIALERSLLLVESQRQAVEIKAAYDMLESTYDQTLAALMSALDARDRETEGHSLRVSHLAAKLGKALNFSHDQLKVLERGSLLHDIGKIGISDTILHKPGPLNEEEWKIMKLHPDIGAKIVAGIPFLQDTIPLIRHHQERWDGTGYPDALYGEEIPILARMFAIVDAFDALTSKRPYRERTMSTEEALDYLRSQSGILFDPNIIEIFETLIKENQPNLLID
ncbi:MAG TPA: HD domain-containing protein, partial [Anaerolineales bacterium]|nr:HD domain-containing protein [Anaerolineales bacterium]